MPDETTPPRRPDLPGTSPNSSDIDPSHHPTASLPKRVGPNTLGGWAGLAPGQTLGHYTIRALIGQGGMGAVYEAEQDRPRRAVALKVIRPGVASAETLKRFAHESEVLGRLQHPGIAQVYEAGTIEGGTGGAIPFFAMELIRGVPISVFAEDRRLSTRERLALLVKVCDAVQHAHGKGIIHRDLKPGNILVDETGQPKVLDFGVARVTDSDIQSTTLNTDIGQLIGTVPYMSPEQAAGDPAELDTRSDVYALGVIAYELLAGRLPYDLARKMVHEAVRVIREDEPTRLSSVNRSLRGDIETIVGKALAKEKTRRYQTAAELAGDITRYLKDEPIAARPASTWYQLRKFSRRNTVLVGGVAASFIILMAGMGTTTWQAFEAKHQRDFAKGETKRANDKATEALQAQTLAESRKEEAIKEAREARRQSGIAAGVNTFLVDLLVRTSPYAQSSSEMTIRQLFDAAGAMVGGRFADAPEVEASVRHVIGCLYQALGELDKAEEHLTRSLELAKALGESGIVQRADTEGALADVAIDRRDFARAEELLGSSLRTCRAQGESMNITMVMGLGNLAKVKVRTGKPREALPLLREAVAALPVDIREKGFLQYATRTGLAESLMAANGPGAEPEAMYREALGVAEKVFAQQPLFLATARANLAEYLRGAGTMKRLEESRDLMTTALKTIRELMPGDNEQVANLLDSLGITQVMFKQSAEAEKLHREALGMRERLWGRDAARNQRTLYNLANVIAGQTGRSGEALEIAGRAVDSARRLEHDPRGDLGLALTLYGTLLHMNGDHAGAVERIREGLPIVREKAMQPPYAIARVQVTLVSALTDLGKFAEGEAELNDVFVQTENGRLLPLIMRIQLETAVVRLYEKRHAAEPDGGYDKVAKEWAEVLERERQRAPPAAK